MARVTEIDRDVAWKIGHDDFRRSESAAEMLAAYREEVTAPLLAALRDLVNSNGFGVGALRNARALLEKVDKP